MLHHLPPKTKNLYLELLQFLRHPTDTPAAAQTGARKLSILFWVLLLDIAACGVLTAGISLAEKLELFNSENHAVAELMRQFPVWGILLLGILVVPLLEEVIFRFGLRFRQGFITTLLAVSLATVAGFGFYLLPLLWALGVMAASGALLILYLLNAYTISSYLERAWVRAYRYIFYGVAAVFGLIHITNFIDFNYASAAVLLVPVLVAPQIVGGLLMGFMRVRYGFWWGYLLHASHNAFFMLLGLLFMQQLEVKLNKSNDNYTIQVEEVQLYNPVTTTRSTISQDSITFKNTELKDVISQLLLHDKVVIEGSKNSRMSKVLNIRFKNHVADQDMGRKYVLTELKRLYNFEIKTEKVEHLVWDIEVEDNAKLLQHAVADIGKYEVSITPDTVSMRHIKLPDMLPSLNEAYAVTLIDKTASMGSFNFAFKRTNFERLKNDLREQYGLALYPSTVLAEQAVVAFK